ncbi:MAG: isocitrate lyase/PEP mutase family protein [Acidimicrobiia bacterium]
MSDPAPSAERAARFLELHHGAEPLLMPNPWDAGSARLLASLGFAALATTSSGFAATHGRLDGSMARDEVLGHARTLAAAVAVPVSADREDCFATAPEGVADTVRAAAGTGLAGCSVEDFRRAEDRILPLDLAADRVRAAAEAAHAGPVPLVLTGRAENFLHGHADLGDTIARLQAYQEAGADVLFAPGVVDADQLRTLVAAVDRPVNVLPRPGAPTIAELGSIGVRRISVGGSFCWAAMAAVTRAATELRDHGTYGYWDAVPEGLGAARAAFTG